MGSIRKKLDIRPLGKGIVPHGVERALSNEIGNHVFHVGDNVEVHSEGYVITCKIIGEVNSHIMGEVVNLSSPKDEENDFKIGKKAIFDEENIFEFFEG
jgi:hypothetical protein